MDQLLEFTNDERAQSLVSRLSETTDLVQGYGVDVDPQWLDAWYSREEFRGPDQVILDQAPGFQHSPEPLDINWRPKGWEERRVADGLPLDPRILLIILRPASSADQLSRLWEEDYAEIPVRFETRPIARLMGNASSLVRPVAGGISLSTYNGGAGTLGGSIRLESGMTLATSCQHVVPLGELAFQPSPQDSNSPHPLGHCMFGPDLDVGRVNPFNAGTRLDLALIPIGEDAVVPAMLDGTPIVGTAPASRATPGESVTLLGKASGQVNCRVGAAIASLEFQHGNNPYALGPLFEIRRPSTSWFSWLRYGPGSPPVRGGDSGAWAWRDGPSGPEWLGTVVGADGPYGYASPAELTCRWIADNLGDAVADPVPLW